MQLPIVMLEVSLITSSFVALLISSLPQTCVGMRQRAGGLCLKCIFEGQEKNPSNFCFTDN